VYYEDEDQGEEGGGFIMSIAIAALTRRLERLEPIPEPQPDIIGMVLGSLNDSDLGLLHEMSYLRETGFDEVQTAVMMADRHEEAMKAVSVFKERYAVIAESRRPKRIPKIKGRRYTTRRDVTLPKKM